MRRTVAGLFMIVVLGVTACGGGNSFAANLKSNFLNACEQQGSPSPCECALKQIEAHVSQSTFEASERAQAQGASPPKWQLAVRPEEVVQLVEASDGRLVAEGAVGSSAIVEVDPAGTDTELGVKIAFIKETKHFPQIGSFTMFELPTGNYDKGLGVG